ncbi:MAG: GNAT family N-acetyltransferase [Nitrospiraceae bacterium]|nr:GNAT family N-acetyltransferase [Nitrospira sp.]MCB9776322.1 GNAT family N-acetyltransferase [Nitrospiraceae bacterium]
MPIRFPIDTQLQDGSAVRLALAEPKDIESLRQLYNVIVDEGTSFPHEQMPSDGDFQAYWFGGCGTVLAFVRTGTNSLELAGAYYVKANWPGRAKHVANAGFIVAPRWRGKGLGRLLGETMLAHARSLGFRSVIFNLVFSENHVAHRLWTQLGFRELATLPQAVRKDDGTYQDAHILFRSLCDDSHLTGHP